MRKKAIRKRTRSFQLLAGLLVLLMIPVQLPWTETRTMAQTTEPQAGWTAFISQEATYIPDTEEQKIIRSVTSELRQYDWDCYSNDYYYLKLSEKERLLYERLDAVCGSLLTTKKNASNYQIGNGGVTRKGTEMVSTEGLSTLQVYKVLYVFIYGNPQYYFLNNILLLSSKQKCAIGIYDIFADGASREQASLQIKQALTQYETAITPGTVYETDKQIHDLLCKRLHYLTDTDVLEDGEDPYYTQSVYGALTSGGTVCAGYTKLYAMLCSYFGLDCVCVLSDDHAWNEVRYGDQWYLVDVTWDDTGGDGAYFHLTDKQMKSKDQNNYHVAEDFYSSMRPAATQAFSSSLKSMQGLAQPTVTVSDTAKGVKITLASSSGDIYYTLDGSIPGSKNKYTKPISLTKSGNYVLTAITTASGKLSSAYDICSVRIAGGSVSIESALNDSAKTVDLKMKSANTYQSYEVSYASKKSFKDEKTLIVDDPSATISGLKKGTTCYIRVRGCEKDAYGNYYYTAYSKVKAVKITK